MALTQITTDGIKDGTITGTDLTTNVDLVDNQKLRLGTGNDLRIFHNGSDSLIQHHNATTNNDLHIQSDTKTIFGSVGGAETHAVFNDDGAVELYHNNSKKFETTSSGLNIHEATDKVISFSGGIGEIGSVPGFQGSNTAGSALTSLGMRGVDLRFATGNAERLRITSGGNVSIQNDSGKFTAGASDDLQIYHDGSNSYLYQDGTGELRANAATFRVMDRNGGETQLLATQNGAVELYYDNSKKFETTSSGATVTGHLTTTGEIFAGDDIGLPDNKKITFGTGADLRIFHDPSGSGTNKIISNAAQFGIYTNGNLQIFNENGGANIADFIEGGACNLYFDASKKFETTSGGCTLTGTLTTTSGINAGNNISMADNTKLKAGTGDDLQIYHDGSHSYVQASGVGALKLLGNNNDDIQLQPRSGYNSLRCKPNAAVELYYDNSKKLHTDSDGVEIFGNRLRLADDVKAAFGSGADLQIYHDSANSWVKENGTGILFIDSTNGSEIRISSNSNAKIMARFVKDSAVELYNDNARRLYTRSNGITVQGNSSAVTIDLSTDTTYRGSIYADANNGINFLNSATSFSFRIQNDGVAVFYGHALPQANNTYDLGSTSLRWRNIYTNDLNLSNEGGANDVDGTWGSYTIQEGAEDLFLVNKRNGKKYKFALTEVS